MKANDPLFEGTTALELWRHDDDEPEGCHVSLYYRSNGDKDVFEMRLADYVVPLHPEFPPGNPLAAHILMHIAQDLYEGKLVCKSIKNTSGLNIAELLAEWKKQGEPEGGDRKDPNEGEDR